MPSNRGRTRRPKIDKEKLPPTLVHWVEIERVRLELHELHGYDDGANYEDIPEFGMFLKNGSKRAGVRLTSFTEADLDEFEKFFQYAIDKARQSVGLLDERVREEYENGDDASPRLYRPDAKVHHRQWRKREDSKGVQERPDVVVELPNRPADDGPDEVA